MFLKIINKSMIQYLTYQMDRVKFFEHILNFILLEVAVLLLLIIISFNHDISLQYIQQLIFEFVKTIFTLVIEAIDRYYRSGVS